MGWDGDLVTTFLGWKLCAPLLVAGAPLAVLRLAMGLGTEAEFNFRWRDCLIPASLSNPSWVNIRKDIWSPNTPSNFPMDRQLPYGDWTIKDSFPLYTVGKQPSIPLINLGRKWMLKLRRWLWWHIWIVRHLIYFNPFISSRKTILFSSNMENNLYESDSSGFPDSRVSSPVLEFVQQWDGGIEQGFLLVGSIFQLILWVWKVKVGVQPPTPHQF